jgi:hypothetical protein
VTRELIVWTAIELHLRAVLAAMMRKASVLDFVRQLPATILLNLPSY